MIETLIRDARSEPPPDARFVQLLSNEHELAHSAFACVPKPVGPGIEHHLHALENDAFGLAPDLEDSLAPVNLLAHFANHFAEPRFDFLQFQRPIVADVKRRYAFVVVPMSVRGSLLFVLAATMFVITVG